MQHLFSTNKKILRRLMEEERRLDATDKEKMKRNLLGRRMDGRAEMDEAEESQLLVNVYFEG